MKKPHPTQQEQAFMNVLLENRYTATEIIARGGMGTVFGGTDSMFDRRVAIKLLRESLDEEALIRFEREASIISSFSHPNLVQLFSQGTYDGFTYLILEYVPGKSLSDILAQGRLSVQATVELGVCVSSALVEAHSANVIHRDLKPGNILVEQRGDHVNAKLVDFGVAYAVSDGTRLTAAGAICGTPGYIAPEQIAGIDVTASCDLYSLGIVLFECLTGKRAFEGNNPIAVLIRQTQHQTPSLKNYASLEIPAKVERLVSDLVCREPSDRPRSAQDVLLALEEIQKTLSLDSDDLRKTMPLQSITKKDIAQSLSMPMRVGGGWDQLLGETPGVQEHVPIDPQIYNANPNLIDISFEFVQGELLTKEHVKPILDRPKVVDQRFEPKPPVYKRDFSKLELAVVERNVLPVSNMPRARRPMKPWLQFLVIMFVSMTVTLTLVYFFLERDSVVDRLPNTKMLPSLPKNAPKPSPPKEWKRVRGM